MPSTSQILTRIQQLCHGYNRIGINGILPVLQETCRYMESQDYENNLILDAATGQFPIFATQNNVFQYEAPSAVRKVAKILILEQEPNYDSYGFYSDFYWRGNRYYEVPVTTRPASPQSNALIYFRDNPGATASRYYRAAYRFPTEILSTSIQLTIPEKFHDLVIDGCVNRIKQQQYGESEPYLLWRNERVPTEYGGEMNENAARSPFITTRHC